MEIKTMNTTATVNEAHTIATQMDTVLFCTFGDERFKKELRANKGCSVYNMRLLGTATWYCWWLLPIEILFI
jgi:hypothetical protein